MHAYIHTYIHSYTVHGWVFDSLSQRERGKFHQSRLADKWVSSTDVAHATGLYQADGNVFTLSEHKMRCLKT